jgi:hypothetical protein
MPELTMNLFLFCIIKEEKECNGKGVVRFLNLIKAIFCKSHYIYNPNSNKLFCNLKIFILVEECPQNNQPEVIIE